MGSGSDIYAHDEFCKERLYREQLKVRTRAIPPDWSPDADGLPESVQRVLVARGVSGIEDFELSSLLDWRLLLGIDEATRLLVDAIQQKSHILIVGDYDADGATGVALAMDCLSHFGAEHTSFLVPNRLKHSYGLTPELVDLALVNKPDLIVTVDNGISSVEGVAYAAECGIPVVVTDHHLSGAELPAAAAIVNPNQPGCGFPSKNLAGVGVMFYLLLALRAKLRELGWFRTRKEPNMAQGLDLVALGTIADIVPLDYNNRCLVQGGLKRMRSGLARPGIMALAAMAKINLECLGSRDLGFRLAPRLNAAGRMEDMACGIRCLLAKTEGEAKTLAEELNQHNNARRKKEANMQDKARRILKQVVGAAKVLPDGICLADKSWHVGLIGIVAARIREYYQKPALVLAPAPGDDEQIWRGSARSVEGINIRDVLVDIDARNPGLLNGFGGHAMAAGMSVKDKYLPRLPKIFSEAIKRAGNGQSLSTDIMVDGELAANEFSITLAMLLTEISPWGKDFPEPVFQGEFKVSHASLINDQFLKLRVCPVNGEGRWLNAIAFGPQVTDWSNDIKRAILAYELSVNSYRGMELVQLVIRHWEGLSSGGARTDGSVA